MIAKAQLYQECGVQGPSGRFEIDSLDGLFAAAVEWADGQAGHPWDGILVHTLDEQDQIAETMQIECMDGEWEVVA